MPPTIVFGIVFVIIAAVLLLLELKVSGFGLLGIAGIAALVAGLILIFGLSPASLPILLAVTIPLVILISMMAILTHRARKIKVSTGEAGMVGLEGRAETSLLPEGKVSVRGELWDAWSHVRIERGESVRVVGVRGLKLEVTASAPNRIPRRPIAGELYGNNNET